MSLIYFLYFDRISNIHLSFVLLIDHYDTYMYFDRSISFVLLSALDLARKYINTK